VIKIENINFIQGHSNEKNFRIGDIIEFISNKQKGVPNCYLIREIMLTFDFNDNKEKKTIEK